MLHSDKRAVSEMMGYVVLIAIAVGLSAGVFFYLKLYIPADKPHCSPDIKISIDSATCNLPVGATPLTIGLNITNRGLFSVNSTIVSIGSASHIYRAQLHDPDTQFTQDFCSVPFSNGVGLKPAEQFCFLFNSIGSSFTAPPPTEQQEIVVEPVQWINNQPILCTESISTTTVYCT